MTLKYPAKKAGLLLVYVIITLIFLVWTFYLTSPPKIFYMQENTNVNVFNGVPSEQRYFVISNPPSKNKDIEKLINDYRENIPLPSSGAFSMELHFYKEGWYVSRNFKPHPLGFGQDEGQGTINIDQEAPKAEIASVHINRHKTDDERCVISTFYFFRKYGTFIETERHDEQIIEAYGKCNSLTSK